jgi:hypothetical protein
MKITSVKKIGKRYLINNKISIPYVKENKYYDLVTKWIKDNPNSLEKKDEDAGLADFEIEYSEKKNKVLNGSNDPAIASWDIQRLEALLCLYVQEAPTPFIDGMSEAKGETRRVVAKKILNKSKDYLYKLGKATGEMQLKKNKSK